jgi:tRNA threonylcarbamoyl adenosine modification protein (Sua5/YciO/YrdC/YwlC family)
MSAPILETDPEHPQPRHVERAAKLLESDGLIVCPTDTYYALSCAVDSRKGIERLYALKGRDRKKPLSFICRDLAEVSRYAHLDNFAHRTMKSLTPGPFTFILRATKLVPDPLATKQRQVAIRLPDAAVVNSLAAALGRPLVTASILDADAEPLVDARDLKDAIGAKVDLILDGGIVPFDPSTVVSLLEDRIEILREGQGEIDG